MTNAPTKNTILVLSVATLLTLASAFALGAFAKTAYADDFDFAPYGDMSYDFAPYADTSYDFAPYSDYNYDFAPYADTGYDFAPYGDGYDFAPYDNDYDFAPYGDYDYAPYGEDCWSCYETEYIYEEGVGYSSQSYSQPYSQSYPQQPQYPRSFGTPSYPSYPQMPAPRPQPVYYPVQQQQQQQQQQGGQPINIVNNNNNTNTNTNVNPVTVTTVTPVQSLPVQYPVQYVYQQPIQPIYPPVYQNLYCVLSVSPNYISNGQAATLSWSSTGATSAWLSDGIGMVAVNGSLQVRPNVSRTYTLTVSGPGGSQTCNAFVNVNAGAPYVSLSQIPYTGFDMGPLGNALYWLSLIAFAAAGAYLAVYYLPKLVMRSSTSAQSGVIADAKQAILTALPTAPSTSERGDRMVITNGRHGEVPRIVIARA